MKEERNMKEKYVRPMIEKIAFDGDIITASGDSGDTRIQGANSSPETCTRSQNGKFTWHGQSGECDKV